LCKAAALALVWALFFSPAHRPDNSAAATSRHLALESPAGVAAGAKP